MKASSNVGPDLFAAPPVGATPELGAVLAGLDRLAHHPLWSTTRWAEEITAARAFADRWQTPAMACGWTLIDLWGAHPRAPGARLSCLGAGWLVARRGYHVLEVGAGAILVGSQLRIRRVMPDPDTLLAWELCRPG